MYSKQFFFFFSFFLSVSQVMASLSLHATPVCHGSFKTQVFEMNPLEYIKRDAEGSEPILLSSLIISTFHHPNTGV